MSPIAIGGTGGSGTRVVAQVLRELGFHIGDDLNYALDNLWFTMLFRRRGFDDRPREEIAIGIRLFEKAMLGDTAWSEDEVRFLDRAASEAEERLANRPGRDGRRWAGERRDSMRHAVGPGPGHAGWGWKEPCTHVFLDPLERAIEGLRYIHVIRDGIEMAYKPLTHFQLFLWGERYGVTPPGEPELVPSLGLRFWVRSNQRALEVGEGVLAGRFLLLRYESICAHPVAAVEAIADFAGARIDSGRAQELATFVEDRAVRHDRVRDTSELDAEDLAAMEALGYTAR